MHYDVRLEILTDPKPTAVIRRRADRRDLPKVIPAGCGAVWGMIKANNIKGAGRHVALYLDGKVNLEVGVEVESPISSSGELIGSSLPVGAVATAVHFGPYGRLGEAHQAIVDWCKKNWHQPVGVNWEVYGHWEDDWNVDPSKIRTDVFYLLKS